MAAPEKKWYNEPPAWTAQGNKLTVTTGPGTDFWQKTHYGFQRDNGHFYYQEVEGDFLAQLKFSAQYRDLYDQAGLMVRLDENNWLKCGIEFVEGVQNVSAVVTRDFSDWSIVPLANNPAALWLRVKREGTALEVSYSFDGAKYSLLRLAYIIPAPGLQVGPMCASPDGSGFEATFEEFQVQSL